MVTKQGGTELLRDPVAQKLLASNSPARLAYTWTDGSPRVVPMWFHWDGEYVVFAGPPAAPKGQALRQDPRVAITIDQGDWPYKTLLLRGQAVLDEVEGVAPEYASAATRYFGAEQGAAWVTQVGQMGSTMTRIRVRPEWVGILDFETRFPSAIEKAMAAAGAGSR
jgi:PPOX class probable F420-dependent enzyme